MGATLAKAAGVDQRGKVRHKGQVSPSFNGQDENLLSSRCRFDSGRGHHTSLCCAELRVAGHFFFIFSLCFILHYDYYFFIQKKDSVLAWFCTYLIRSVNFPKQTYVGKTDRTMKIRLAEHNAGLSIHTKKYLPWKLECCVMFCDLERALAFEDYLKGGSGQAFAKRHLWRKQENSHE
jgi:putative endonuclease